MNKMNWMKKNWKPIVYYMFCGTVGALVGTLVGLSWWLVLATPCLLIVCGALAYLLWRPKEENLKL